jgi:hypothetical protein
MTAPELKLATGVPAARISSSLLASDQHLVDQARHHRIIEIVFDPDPG